ELRSLQFICGSTGKKLFLRDGAVQGYCFIIGSPTDEIYVAEGYATAASIHEATGSAVAVAFNAGNLLLVAQGLRERFPGQRLVVCADDDVETEGNPGLSKARAAAEAVGGLVAVPSFGDARPKGATDFNDLHRLVGLDAARRCLLAADPVQPGWPE